MRRTVVIDDALLAEARDALGTQSIRETIEGALREAIRLRRLRAFAEALGTFDLAETREDLLRQRRVEAERLQHCISSADDLSNARHAGAGNVTGVTNVTEHGD